MNNFFIRYLPGRMANCGNRVLLIMVLWIFLTPLAPQSQPVWPSYSRSGDRLSVQFNGNVEFTGLIFFMGSIGEAASEPGAAMPGGMLQKDWFVYQLSLYRQYAEHLSDSNLHIAAGYLERLQPSDLLPLVMMCGDFPNATLHPGIGYNFIRNYAPGSDSIAAAREATRFLEALNRLYRNMSFEKYLPVAANYYQDALSELRKAFPDEKTIPAMEAFYRRSFSGYVLVPSLTIPSGMAFGVHTEEGGQRTVYNVFGPYDTMQATGNGRIGFGFHKPVHILELSIHEFGHSFINDAFYNTPPSLFTETAHLFEPIREAMENQGYDSWENCINEYFVRAGEVVIARSLGRRSEADELLRAYTGDRKFIYLPVIIPLLEEYSRNKAASYTDVIIKALGLLAEMKREL